MRQEGSLSQQRRRACQRVSSCVEGGPVVARVPVPHLPRLPPDEEGVIVTEAMRLLVFGGRTYPYKGTVDHEILQITDGVPFERLTIIHGDANRKKRIGADYWAHEFCERWALWGVTELPYPAKWEDFSHPDSVERTRSDGVRYNVRAGFIRNQQMLDEGVPTHALGFPGGTGTADMCRRVKLAIERGAKITLRMIDR
jgi:hypothetical protein